MRWCASSRWICPTRLRSQRPWQQTLKRYGRGGLLCTRTTNDQTKKCWNVASTWKSLPPFLSLFLTLRSDPKLRPPQARAIFLQGQAHINKALKFYVLDGFVSDHISCVQDMSSLFRTLAFFESDNDRIWYITIWKRLCLLSVFHLTLFFFFFLFFLPQKAKCTSGALTCWRKWCKISIHSTFWPSANSCATSWQRLMCKRTPKYKGDMN